MRYLVLISLLSCVCCSPAIQIPKGTEAPNCIQGLVPDLGRSWYSTTVDIVGRHLSGLLFFKKLDNGNTRCVFTSEPGATLFDFEFSPDGGFKIHSIIKQLDKRPIVKTLQEDLGMIMATSVARAGAGSRSNHEIWFPVVHEKFAEYFITNADCTKLLKALKKDNKKTLVDVAWYASGTSSPDSVSLTHHTFNMKMNLRLLRTDGE